MAVPARRFLRKRLLFLLIPLGLLGTFAWQLAIIPTDPVYRGHRLSWWLRQQSDTGIGNLTGNDLRAIGPDAVHWLVYTAEHGRSPRHESQFLGWVRELFHLEYDRYDEKTWALFQLNKMGREAAPAIPALVRILERDANAHGTAAADALLQSGPEARDEVLRLFAEGSHVARLCLIMNLPHYGAAPAENLEYLLTACRDPDPHHRLRALRALKAFGGPTGFRAEMAPAIPTAIDLLTNPAVPPREVIDVLAYFREQAAPAIPQLVAALDDPDPETRKSAVVSLITIDPKGQTIAPQMRAWLQSSDSCRREMARRILLQLGKDPDE